MYLDIVPNLSTIIYHRAIICKPLTVQRKGEEKLTTKHLRVREEERIGEGASHGGAPGMEELPWREVAGEERRGWRRRR